MCVVGIIASAGVGCSGRSFLIVGEEHSSSAGSSNGGAPSTDTSAGSDGGTGSAIDPAGGSGGTTAITTKSPDDDTSGAEPDVQASEPDTLSEPDSIVDEPATTRGTPCGVARGPDADATDSEACIEGGVFQMGSTTPQPDTAEGLAAHSPVRDVMLSSYFIDTHEVTVARYRACVDDGVCQAPNMDAGKGCTYQSFAGSGEDLPIVCATWTQARTFCTWDEERRLPTEAEWEFAARGSEGRRYAWGDEFSCERAVLSSSSLCTQYDSARPSEVGSAPLGKSPEGVVDLTGNAGEWVADWVGSYPRSAEMDPTGPTSGGARVIRGSAWLDAPGHAYAYLRRSAIPEASAPVGFRCARAAAQ